MKPSYTRSIVTAFPPEPTMVHLVKAADGRAVHKLTSMLKTVGFTPNYSKVTCRTCRRMVESAMLRYRDGASGLVQDRALVWLEEWVPGWERAGWPKRGGAR